MLASIDQLHKFGHVVQFQMNWQGVASGGHLPELIMLSFSKRGTPDGSVSLVLLKAST